MNRSKKPKVDPITLIDLSPYLPLRGASAPARAPAEEPNKKKDGAKPVKDRADHSADKRDSAAETIKLTPELVAAVKQQKMAVDPAAETHRFPIPERKHSPTPQTSRREPTPSVPAGSPRVTAGAPPIREAASPAAAGPAAAVSADAIPQWLKERAKVLEARAARRHARMRHRDVELPYAEVELPGGFTRVAARIAALVIFALCGAIVFTLRWENVDFYWYRPFLNAYSIAVASFILSRFLIALFYRAPRDVGLEPSVSIIITAFNEEDAILRTVACCYAADYPAEKLEVIVVDDGSTDGTVPELERATRRYPALIVEKFAQNKGKREAMAAGARLAKGDILLYVDSDSFVRRDGIRKMVQGFVDPTVAAVAGHTEVANARVNALTRMQDVRYYVAFRVMKAAESMFGAVTCCPGCFSAYRRSCVLEVLEPWLHQRFLGVQATFGDDRSLTNFLLRKYKVIYSSEAVCTTIVPEEHKRFLKQQLRWKKSWLRECLIAATFMWKKHPLAALSFYAQLCFPIIAPILVLRAFVWLPVFAGDFFSMAIYAFGVLMIGMIFSCYYLFWKADGVWIYGAHFTIYYMFVLIWQMPYAIATSRDNRWGTR